MTDKSSVQLDFLPENVSSNVSHEELTFIYEYVRYPISLISICGILLNIISIYIVYDGKFAQERLSREERRRIPTFRSLYDQLALLTFAYTISLISSLIHEFVNSRADLRNTNVYSFLFPDFLKIGSDTLSCWLLVLFTFAQFFSKVYVDYYRDLSERTIKAIIITTFLFAWIYAIPKFFELEAAENPENNTSVFVPSQFTRCNISIMLFNETYTITYFELWQNQLDLLLRSIVPNIFICSFAVWPYIDVQRRRKQFRSSLKSEGSQITVVQEYNFHILIGCLVVKHIPGGVVSSIRIIRNMYGFYGSKTSAYLESSERLLLAVELSSNFFVFWKFSQTLNFHQKVRDIFICFPRKLWNLGLNLCRRTRILRDSGNTRRDQEDNKMKLLTFNNRRKSTRFGTEAEAAVPLRELNQRTH